MLRVSQCFVCLKALYSASANLRFALFSSFQLPCLHTDLAAAAATAACACVLVGAVCSPHVWTGLIGLTLLSFQAMLPLFFAESRDSRTVVSAVGAVAVLGVGRSCCTCRRRGTALQTAADSSKAAEVNGSADSAPRYALPRGTFDCCCACRVCCCPGFTARLPGKRHPGTLPGACRPGPEAGPEHLSSRHVTGRVTPVM